MTVPDSADELLGAMFTAWRRDIESEPVPDIVDAVMRGDHAPGQELSRP